MWSALLAFVAMTYGPYNGSFLRDGVGLEKKIHAPDAAEWSMYLWFRLDQQPGGQILLGAVGERSLTIADGHLVFRAGRAGQVSASSQVTAGAWRFAAATYDGATLRLYQDGKPVGESAMKLPGGNGSMTMGPFGGRILGFTYDTELLPESRIQVLATTHENFDLARFEAGSKCWPFQTRAQAGYRAPQDPGTLPKSLAAFSKPVSNAPPIASALGAWRLIEEPKVQANGNVLSKVGFDVSSWMPATVPGTVLTTMINNGIYPDPDYGLNNMAIPESLSRQDYWYRTEFMAPALGRGQHFVLTFEGINYTAEVWLNGQRLGDIRGAFVRGVFDASSVQAGSRNALAVRIAPPPHPGIGHEQSITAGPGENGGAMCLDGPTFVCTEGWDWIPAIRDRNTGIWQDVTLTAVGTVAIGDPRVITKVPSTDRAEVTVHVPLTNSSGQTVASMVRASFEGVGLSRQVSVAPGKSEVTFAATVEHPRLWWPNGYGKPELYHLKLVVEGSDSKQLRFGIREITYELSLLDSAGALRRVEYAPAKTAESGEQVIDTRHEGILKAAAGWVYSLPPGQEHSPAISTVADTRAQPFLIIKVNGVRIVCKGGSWGIDDSRKRSSREHLEPFFRLHRDANLTMIRNWVGQSTEEVFYDLADEYGLLVWNDFWESTQDYNVEPSDSALFLDNARETLLRYRNHPSIVMWCGRNEGVPPPAINVGLDQLIRDLDGTRIYMPTSNQVNLQNSGPYLHHEPVDYFTTLSRGFAVEVGIPSFPTLEAFQNAVPVEDQWPPSDTWAYHDWHFGGNGDTRFFMAALEQQFGVATDLTDFERKAQMINYVNHRAIFEGMNAHLWNPNTGRMLWMTQPAWPSTNWQILSSDYDTQGSFYGAKKGCEPVHVQMNLPGLETAVVNNTAHDMDGLTLRARAFSIDGKQVFSKEQKVNAAPVSESEAFRVELPEHDLSLVKLELRDARGGLVSENFYWYAAELAVYRRLNDLPQVELTGSAKANGSHITVKLANSGAAPALMSKLTLVNEVTGKRLLPAYFSDNYVSLLAGESKVIEIDCPSAAAAGQLALNLRGWNVRAAAIAVSR
jgi:beta-galactosidase/beta-glucuronidase